MTLLDASLATSDENPRSEEARRQAIRARELIHFARHMQRSRQRLKEHHDHLASINRQVTQKIHRQRVEQAQWEADHAHQQNGVAAPAAPETAAAPRLLELERALAEERDARQRTESQLGELQEQSRAAEQRHAEHNGRQAEWDRSVEETAELRTQLETIAGRLEAAEAENERLRGHEVEGLRSELAGHQSELEQTRSALAEARAHAERLGEAAADAGAVEGLRQELAGLQSALADREREQSATLARLTELEAEQQSRAAQQGDQNKILRQEIEQLHRLLAERDQAQSDAAMHLTELRRSHQGTLAQISQELEQARQQLAEREASPAAVQAPERAPQPEFREETSTRRPEPTAPEAPPTPVVEPTFAATPERPRPAPPASARPSRPSLRLPPAADLAPTVIASSPLASRPPSGGEIAPAGFDLEAVEVGLTALRKSLEVDRRAVEDELLRPDEIRSGLRPPAPTTADLTNNAPAHVQKAREILKAESERLKRAISVPRDTPAVPDKALALRRAAVESSPVFELPPPLKSAPEAPPEPPAKPQPRQQRGTLHGLRKWLGEK